MKRSVIRILTGALLFAVCAILPVEGVWRLLLFLVPYLIIGGDVLWRAVRNILRGSVFDENFLMSIATVGAFCLRDYAEAVAVMLFYQVGELFQSYAVRQSRNSISELMDIRPDTANVVRDEGILTVSPEDVQIGETILVKVGEKIPLDGVVTEGSSLLDTSALTGESMPREIREGDSVISGCINTSAVLKVRVTKIFEDSTVSKILDLVENASSQKAKSENFITKFAKVYTPVVVIAAVLLAVVPPLILRTGFLQWIERALIFLVVSCPCALVLSIPLSFFGGIGGASKRGILVKGSNYLEALAKVETVVFDKTGTLTKGTFSVTDILPVNMPQEELLMYAAHAEIFSDHPISLSLKKAYGIPDAGRVTDAEELAGHGVKALVDGVRVCAGNKKLMEKLGLICENPDLPGTVIHVAVGERYAGCVVVADSLKADAAEAVGDLRKIGVKNIVMLTGDNRSTAETVGKQLKVDQVWSELLPADKVSKIKEFLSDKSANRSVAFVGDGINDAPVLALADVGIAMGGLGSDAAIEAADVVLMDDMPSKIPVAVKIARRTLKIVKENIVFALTLKGIVLILSAFGLANMWWAVFSDVGVSFLAILNAARALRVKKI